MGHKNHWASIHLTMDDKIDVYINIVQVIHLCPLWTKMSNVTSGWLTEHGLTTPQNMRSLMGHFRDESFQTIYFTSTNNQIHTNNTKYTKIPETNRNTKSWPYYIKNTQKLNLNLLSSVRTPHMCAHITAHNCSTQYSTDILTASASPQDSRQWVGCVTHW